MYFLVFTASSIASMGVLLYQLSLSLHNLLMSRVVLCIIIYIICIMYAYTNKSVLVFWLLGRFMGFTEMICKIICSMMPNPRARRIPL